ncbi:MAG: hypothetical protein Q9M33_01315 [Robiginitomaculum sp.]|nr:hypothetical protein [Robiginitomaculum sp.]MDQ7076892.1 hypothetical protein [Robiginitomaculum sp.]
MRRIVFGVFIALALVFAGFAMLVGAASNQVSQTSQIRVELQNGL